MIVGYEKGTVTSAAQLSLRRRGFAHRSFRFQTDSVEFAFGFFLIRPKVAGFDFGARVVLALHRRTGYATQHGELAHVRERVGNRPLKQTLTRCRQIRVGSEVIIKALQRRMKAIDFLIPLERL